MIRNLVKKFEDIIAVDELNLEIKQGELFGVLSCQLFSVTSRHLLFEGRRQFFMSNVSHTKNGIQICYISYQGFQKISLEEAKEDLTK